ncbi:MAG: Heme A synthase [Alphaproteobacteria bacterium MarineAlpha9_Bin3]|nr:MAG: Heme A synthase [Alphaproteobacteria bacterium MarineAlpha9_Bin3]
MLNNISKNKIITLLKIFSGLLIVVIFAQISLGSAVRLTGSGLSCPDWPLCYGLWFPDQEKLSNISDVNYEFYQIMLEWIHRFNAAIFIAPLALIVFIVGLKVKNLHINKITLYAILVLLALQGLMGGFTVFDKNSPWSVAVHLGFALILLLFVIRVFMQSLNLNLDITIPNIKRKLSTLIISIIFIMFTMLMGAIVSKSGSSLACDIWPLCSNDGLSIFQHNKFIHITHRILAVISAVCIYFVFNHYRDTKQYKLIYGIRNILVTVITLQILIGATVIFTELNMFIAMFHQSLAVILFMMLSFLFWFTLQINYKK